MIAIPVDERLALQDLMTAYCYAVDKLSDVEVLLDLFTEDAELDFTAIGLPLMNGRAEIKRFFDGVFADMSHHAHYITNFRPVHYNGKHGAMTAYVIGIGRSKDGNTVEVNVQYTFEAVKQDDGAWKCVRYSMFSMMPLPGSLAQIHGTR
ncbi:MAG: hypothetical protein RIS94_2066 [Pseudomonadota bacterium]|jgi:ketosteroid isomerase-like protein